jgi:hypothetical protein
MEWPKRPSNNSVNNNVQLKQLVGYDGGEENTNYSPILILNTKKWHGAACDGFRT